MIRYLILEDIPPEAEMLKKIITENFSGADVQCANGVKDARQIMQERKIDLFILDIHLNEEMNGLQFAEEIRKTKAYTDSPIIFTTGDPLPMQRAVNTIHIDGYICKPYNDREWVEIVGRAVRKINETFPIRLPENQYVMISRRDIVYVESGNKVITFHTTTGQYTTSYMTMKNVMGMNMRSMVRCHDSYIFNRNFFSGYDGRKREVVLEYGKITFVISVGRKYEKEMKKEMGLS